MNWRLRGFLLLVPVIALAVLALVFLKIEEKLNHGPKR